MERTTFTPEGRERVLDSLMKQRDLLTQNLIDDRSNFNERRNQALDRTHDFIIKLSELSFLIAAAIGPIVVGAKIDINIYMFLSLVLFLLNGVFALWRSKEFVENSGTSFMPSSFHQFEIEVKPMIHALHKFISNPESLENYQGYQKVVDAFLDGNAKVKYGKPEKVDYSLDVIGGLFVFATLLLLGAIWPFARVAYFHFLGAMTTLVLILIFSSAKKVKGVIQSGALATEKLREMENEFLKWQKSATDRAQKSRAEE